MGLYHKHRPQKLAQVVGQQSAVLQLKKFLDQGNLPHNILFQGPPGTGKTTLARILANELSSAMDIREINMAETTGIDGIRSLQEGLHTRALSGKAKVFILDEFHAISAQAAKCCLKLLEDTPEHVYFFLCTSEPKKIDKALATRVTSVVLGDLTIKDLSDLLMDISDRDSLGLDPGLASQIARSANGSARTAIVRLEQLHAANYEPKLVAQVLSDVDTLAADLIEIPREVFGPRPSIQKIYQMVSEMDNEKVEPARQMMLSYAFKLFPRNQDLALRVIRGMRVPFYDSKKVGFFAEIAAALKP